MSVDTFGENSQNTLTFFDPEETEAELICADTQASDFDYVPSQTQSQTQTSLQLDSQVDGASQVNINMIINS